MDLCESGKKVYKDALKYGEDIKKLLYTASHRRITIADVDAILDELATKPYYDKHHLSDEHTPEHIHRAYNERSILLAAIYQLPIEFMVMLKIDPLIVGYLYNRWYKGPLLEDVNDLQAEPVMIDYWLRKYDAVLVQILERYYTYAYYTSDALKEDVTRLDEYARVCGVRYKKKVPYGAPQSR